MQELLTAAASAELLGAERWFEGALLHHVGTACCADTCTIEAGYDEGTQRTLGSPVMIRVPNKDQKSKDYAQVGC